MSPRIYILPALFLGIGLFLSACAKSSDSNGGGGGGGGTVADTPCNGPSCYSQNGGGYFLPPPVPNPYLYGPNGGYCGCSVGQRPVFNPQWGYACVSTQYMTYNYYLGYSANNLYGFQGQNTIPLNNSPIAYSPLPYGGTANCQQNIAASCDTRATPACTNGGICRPIGGGSSIGVCTTGQGIESYYPPTPGPYGGYGYGGYPGAYPGAYPNGQYGNCTYKQTSWGGTVWTCGWERSTYGDGNLPR